MIGHAGLGDQLLLGGTVVVAVAVYLFAWSEARGVRPSLWWCSLAAAAVLLADSGPFRTLAERSFTGHMVQHLVILCVAAPATVLAKPVRVASQALRRRRQTAPALRAAEHRLAPLQHASTVLGPLAAIVLMVVIHLTGAYDWALRVPVVHHLEHLGFLLAGIGLWSTVLAPRGQRGAWRVAASFGAVGALALLGMVLTTTTEPLSEIYAGRLGVAEAVTDQHNGAALMWVGGMFLTLPLVLVAVWRWASAEEQAVRRREQLDARAAPRSTTGAQ